MSYYIWFLIIMPISFLFSGKIFGRRSKFFWYDYIGFFILPLLTFYFIYLAAGFVPWNIFFIWFFIGPILEAVAGYSYIKLTGKHLWTYHSYPLFLRTTSIFSSFLWGFFGMAAFAIQSYLTQR